MKIGVCLNWTIEENMIALMNSGVDFVELQLSSLYNVDDTSVESLKSRLQNNSIYCPVMNFMLPANLRCTGDDVNYEAIEEYFENVLKKASILGTKIIVFGSGMSRRLDSDTSFEKGYSQLVYLLREIVSPIFNKYGMICVIEPLSEDNLIKTIDDGLKLVKDVDKHNVKLLIDFYHTATNDEDMCDLSKYATHLKHVHIATKNGRLYPIDTDVLECKAIINSLKDINYDGLISLESRVREGLSLRDCISTSTQLLKNLINSKN